MLHIWNWRGRFPAIRLEIFTNSNAKVSGIAHASDGKYELVESHSLTETVQSCSTTGWWMYFTIWKKSALTSVEVDWGGLCVTQSPMILPPIFHMFDGRLARLIMFYMRSEYPSLGRIWKIGGSFKRTHWAGMEHRLTQPQKNWDFPWFNTAFNECILLH